MATIRLIEKLNKEIILLAKAMFDDRIEASNRPPPEFNTKDIFEFYLDSNPGMREDIDVGRRWGWLFKATSLKVFGLGRWKVDIDTGEYEPGVWVSYSLAHTYGVGIKLTGERSEELYYIYKKWQEEHRMVHKQRDDFESQITNLLARHQTLKQALSEWPALWDFVPAEFKKKHNEDKARIAAEKRKAADKPNVNLDTLNGAIVTHKILKGGFTG